MSDETKLLPCPFCGDTANKPRRTIDAHGQVEFYIMCDGKDCDATHEADTEEEVIRRWNTRTPDLALTRANAALVEQVKRLEKEVVLANKRASRLWIGGEQDYNEALSLRTQLATALAERDAARAEVAKLDAEQRIAGDEFVNLRIELEGVCTERNLLTSQLREARGVLEQAVDALEKVERVRNSMAQSGHDFFIDGGQRAAFLLFDAANTYRALAAALASQPTAGTEGGQP